MGECLNCGKPIENVQGRRPKKYCDNKGKCKGEYFRKQKKEPKYVQKEVYDALNEKYQNILSKINPNQGNIDDCNKGLHEAVINDLTNKNKKSNYTINTIPRLEGESSIDYKIRVSEINEKNK